MNDDPTPLIPIEVALPIDPFWKKLKFGAILSRSSVVVIFWFIKSSEENALIATGTDWAVSSLLREVTMTSSIKLTDSLVKSWAEVLKAEKAINAASSIQVIGAKEIENKSAFNSIVCQRLACCLVTTRS